ncbi:AMP-binding protein [Salininema proteolyticum]|uniref:AMP-binding protein n=1 Tax=Salininema proteolyticum TaxID=1607685 RepID=A0ABV8U0Z5_9ACTN
MSRSGLVRALGVGLHVPYTLVKSRVLLPGRPVRMARQLYSLARWGISPAGAFRANAARVPHHTAVIDPRGHLTYREFQDRATRLAHALPKLHRRPRVGLLCRNHRGFLETVVACSQLGADLVLLNTGASGAQLKSVVEQQRISIVVADAEFAPDLHLPDDVRLLVADESDEHLTIDEVIAPERAAVIPPPAEKGRTVVLTSGTTGTPKGAKRPHPKMRSLTAMLSRIPMKTGYRVHIPAPLFHTWGYAAMQLTMAVRGTFVFTGRFDPASSLRAIARHDCDAAFAVPVMLQRILELDESELDRHAPERLKAVAVSGSRLPGELATRFMDRFGDVLYNLYGSTEVSWAAIAAPGDLRRSPDCAGRPPFGTDLALLGPDGHPVADGERGRIFVSNEMLFEGYTSGGGPTSHEGMFQTGDYGHFDAHGSLVVEGRTDDMIVSGGENVMPREVEDCVCDMDEVAEAAAIGVDDEQFGQRLVAFVVLNPGWDLDEATLKHRVKTRLAAHSVPREVHFIEGLPRNATGKVVPGELRRLLSEAA